MDCGVGNRGFFGDGEVKRGSFAEFAFYPDAAAKREEDSFADGEAESGASVFSGECLFDL